MPGPFSKAYTINTTDRYGNIRPAERRQSTWYTSKRLPDGTLDKKPQVYSMTHDKAYAFYQSYNRFGFYVTPDWRSGLEPSSSEAYVRTVQTAYNKAYARFWNKLNGDDSAGLGIGLAQWRQTWKMVNRSQDRIYSIMNDAAVKSRRRARNGTSLQKERFADLFLEGAFGWSPLFTDIWTSVRVLSGWGNSPVDHRLRWFSANAVSVSNPPDVSQDGGRQRHHSKVFQVGCTLAARAYVSNPNLWLANRMGLVNPAAIAWDAIPWSFLVGMFSNVSSYINSFTNGVGVTLEHGSITYSRRNQVSVWVSNTYPHNHDAYATGESVGARVTKQRTLTQGHIPRPALHFTLPKLEWTNALIGASLLYQQVSNFGSDVDFQQKWKNLRRRQ